MIIFQKKGHYYELGNLFSHIIFKNVNFSCSKFTFLKFTSLNKFRNCQKCIYFEKYALERKLFGKKFNVLSKTFIFLKFTFLKITCLNKFPSPQKLTYLENYAFERKLYIFCMHWAENMSRWHWNENVYSVIPNVHSYC